MNKMNKMDEMDDVTEILEHNKILFGSGQIDVLKTYEIHDVVDRMLEDEFSIDMVRYLEGCANDALLPHIANIVYHHIFRRPRNIEIIQELATNVCFEDVFLHAEYSIGTILLLVTYGANINNQDLKGNTILHEACRNRRRNVDLKYIQELINLGAEINKKNHKDKTPICYSMDKEVITYLLDQGADRPTDYSKSRCPKYIIDDYFKDVDITKGVLHI